MASPKCWIGILFVAVFLGCQKKNYKIEYHVSSEVKQIELKIDFAKGVRPRWIQGNTYAIDLDEQGRATINSTWPITQWHQDFLVIQGKRARIFDDDSEWDYPTVVTRTANGVTSRTKVDGSIYRINLEAARLEPQEQ